MQLDIQLHPHHYLNGPTQVGLGSTLLPSITLMWFAPTHYSMILKHFLKNLMPFWIFKQRIHINNQVMNTLSKASPNNNVCIQM
jgi:hypothetical protein